MAKIIYGLYLPLIFPEGLAPGCGSDFNTLLLARDGKNRPVLRGTALAGALRHAYAKTFGKDLEASFFGSSCGDQSVNGSPSRLKVPDVPLIIGSGFEDTRTHHLRNRHTNVVVDGGLFSLESCPPGTLAEVLLWLEGDSESASKDENFISQIASFFAEEKGGFLLGGSAARGIGRAIFQPGKNPLYRTFDFSNPENLGAYLDFRHNESHKFVSKEWQKVTIKTVDTDRLTVHFKLKIPRGQDILIANGDGAPQRVRNQEGKLCWRFPGSTFRGLFRSWVTHLAARELLNDEKKEYEVVDSYNKFQNEYQLGTTKYDGDSLAWLFVEKIERKAKKESLRKDTPKKYPVQYLFGTAFQRGRIHFSDALVPFEEEPQKLNELPPEENFRSHVRIDPITGGALPGGLFSNTTLTSLVNRTFSVTLFVENPLEKEAMWLAQTLRALDLGLLRLGSSKASGRVALAEAPSACGAYSEMFTEIQPFTVEE